MYPILLKIGPFNIYSYGVMLALAFLVGIILTLYLGKREKIEEEKILDIAVFVMLAAIVGARLLYVILFWNEFVENPIEVVMIWRGGLVFYGGLILALLVVAWRAIAYKISLWKLFDVATPGTALGYSIARIGCFLNGCCYGVLTNLPWGVKFPGLEGIRHPTQIYSSIIVFFIFIFLFSIYSRKSFDGEVFLIGVILYAVYRFFIEFIRYSSVYCFSLTGSQIISIIVLVLGIPILIWRKRA